MPDIDYGEILEALNDKVDLSGSWSAPTTQYDDLTFGASGTTYTAPADGYFIARRTTGSNDLQYITLISGQSQLRSISNANGSGTGLTAFIPVKKGEIVTCSYTASGNTYSIKFVYAQKTN